MLVSEITTEGATPSPVIMQLFARPATGFPTALRASGSSRTVEMDRVAAGANNCMITHAERGMTLPYLRDLQYGVISSRPTGRHPHGLSE